jgi:hypothetical protein
MTVSGGTNVSVFHIALVTQKTLSKQNGPFP